MADYVILIAGNICAGKTEFVKFVEEKAATFNKLVDEHEQTHVVKEFIDPAALDLFYRNRKEYSWLFEESCLNGRIARHLTSKHKSGVQVFDRGMIEGSETFARNSYEEGYLS
ncbi:deoxynucleoside kinase [Candidatus Woesearchaeota archaeon]|nr:deoxynucleoside kinase [Candidatus Woesearchaeota archaeon]